MPPRGVNAETSEPASIASGGRASVVQDSLCAAILRPARDVVADSHRPLLTVGDRAHPVGLNAVLSKEVANRRSAACAEGDVVLTRSALVRMPFDCDRILRVLPQPLRLLLQGRLGLWRQVRAIGREIDEIADVDGEISLRSRRDRTFSVRAELRRRVVLIVGAAPATAITTAMIALRINEAREADAMSVSLS